MPDNFMISIDIQVHKATEFISFTKGSIWTACKLGKPWLFVLMVHQPYPLFALVGLKSSTNMCWLFSFLSWEEVRPSNEYFFFQNYLIPWNQILLSNLNYDIRYIHYTRVKNPARMIE